MSNRLFASQKSDPVASVLSGSTTLLATVMVVVVTEDWEEGVITINAMTATTAAQTTTATVTGMVATDQTENITDLTTATTTESSHTTQGRMIPGDRESEYMYLTDCYHHMEQCDYQ